MKITEGNAFPVGPSEDYQGDVEGILAKLEKAEKSAASQLKSAEPAHDPGRRGHAGWRPPTPRPPRALGKLDVSPADATLNANLAESLGDVGTAYKNAAAEARGKDRAGYKRQGGRAVAAGKDVGTAIDGFGAADYQLDGALQRRRGDELPTLIKDKPKAKAKQATTPTPARSSSRRRSSRSSSSRRPQQPQTPAAAAAAAAAAASRRSRSRRRRRRRLRRRRGLATETRTGGAKAPPVVV